MTVKVLAPAKINLALHVTGQRADGYHELDTLVAFGPAYDVVHVTAATTNSLEISGQGLRAKSDCHRPPPIRLPLAPKSQDCWS